MFANLTDGLSHAFRALSGQNRFTEHNTKNILREIRLALLEADVALPVITTLLDGLKEDMLGQEVNKALKPDQAMIKIVYDQLVHTLGDERHELDFKTQPPAVFLMAGLQGSGKTTSTAKLARYLKDIEHKKTLLVSLDVYRPAAMEQLQILANELELPFFKAEASDKPLNIAKAALDFAKKQFVDVVIFDTAGRLHIDEEMMQELKAIHQAINPIETLFVVDSMTGQDAANTAKAFNEALPLTGVILTKTDGDARGGAALSVKQLTGKPIKFVGTGEKIDALEPFHPDRMASQILGMGDVRSLIEKIEQKTDKQANDKLVKKLKKGGFDLEDYRQQLLQMSNLGGMASLASKLPGFGQMPAEMANVNADQMTKWAIAIINSMTLKERRSPKIIVGSRKYRIAKGSGVSIPEVNKLLKQFDKTLKLMTKLSKPGGMKQMMRMVGNMPGIKGLMGGPLK